MLKYDNLTKKGKLEVKQKIGIDFLNNLQSLWETFFLEYEVGWKTRNYLNSKWLSRQCRKVEFTGIEYGWMTTYNSKLKEV